MARISKYNVQDNQAVLSVKKWRAGLYLRLSKEDGDIDEGCKLESDSISSQRLIIEDFLAENSDIEIIEEYSDDGYSGINFDRPQFLQMIEDIRLGKINCVMVKDLSRFGRNYLESGQYLDIFFPMMDIRFISVVDNIDSYLYPSSMSNISVSFKNVMNEEYCRDISNKIRSTFVAKRENGEYICGFALYGYVRDPDNKGKLLIDPEAADIVRQIYQWFGNGMSFRGITFKLNELGIPNPTKYKSMKYPNYHRNDGGGLWNIQTIRSILMNRMYAGDLVQGKYEKISHKIKKIKKLSEEHWVTVENHHDAIVDKETFFHLQEYLKRDIRVSQNTKELALFAGFLKCADCGCQMVKKNASREKFRDQYHYYTCRTYDLQTKSACTRHTIRSDYLINTVFLSISKFIEIVVDMDELILKINNSPRKRSATTRIESLIKTKETEKSKVERILMDLYPDYKNNLITKDQYLQFKAKYESDINGLEKIINNLKSEFEKTKSGSTFQNSFIQKFIKVRNFDELTREILLLFVDEIKVYEGGKIEIIFNYIDEFKSAFQYINDNKELIGDRIVKLNQMVSSVSHMEAI